jgi:hypothetical protein
VSQLRIEIALVREANQIMGRISGSVIRRLGNAALRCLARVFALTVSKSLS